MARATTTVRRRRREQQAEQDAARMAGPQPTLKDLTYEAADLHAARKAAGWPLTLLRPRARNPDGLDAPTAASRLTIRVPDGSAQSGATWGAESF